MGVAERHLAQGKSKANAESLSNAVYEYLQQRDEILKKISEDHNVKLERVLSLAGVAEIKKKKRETSNWNIMVHYKQIELQEGTLYHFSSLLIMVFTLLPAEGMTFPVQYVHNAVRNDRHMMALLEDPTGSAMSALRVQYFEEKEDKEKTLYRVSQKHQTNLGIETLNTIQLGLNRLNDLTGAWGFAVIGRSVLTSGVDKGFAGRGKVDRWLRETFNHSVQELCQSFEDAALKYTKRKFYALCSLYLILTCTCS